MAPGCQLGKDVSRYMQPFRTVQGSDHSAEQLCAVSNLQFTACSPSSLHPCPERGSKKVPLPSDPPESTSLGSKAGLASAQGTGTGMWGQAKKWRGRRTPVVGGTWSHLTATHPKRSPIPTLSRGQAALPVKSCSVWSPVPRPQKRSPEQRSPLKLTGPLCSHAKAPWIIAKKLPVS